MFMKRIIIQNKIMMQFVVTWNVWKNDDWFKVKVNMILPNTVCFSPPTPYTKGISDCCKFGLGQMVCKKDLEIHEMVAPVSTKAFVVVLGNCTQIKFWSNFATQAIVGHWIDSELRIKDLSRAFNVWLAWAGDSSYGRFLALLLICDLATDS